MQFDYLCDGCRAEFSTDSSVWNDGSRLCHLFGGIDCKFCYIWLFDLYIAEIKKRRIERRDCSTEGFWRLGAYSHISEKVIKVAPISAALHVAEKTDLE